MVATPLQEVLLTMAKLKNLIPMILQQRKMTITELQIKSGLGWPTVHKVATEEYIPDRTSVKTLNAIASALELSISDLYAEEKE
jgi:DNA-binding Xre family transcriptional regulator